jgi:hypothetical protein
LQQTLFLLFIGSSIGGCQGENLLGRENVFERRAGDGAADASFASASTCASKEVIFGQHDATLSDPKQNSLSAPAWW